LLQEEGHPELFASSVIVLMKDWQIGHSKQVSPRWLHESFVLQRTQRALVALGLNSLCNGVNWLNSS
jgi:hypothetical protein